MPLGSHVEPIVMFSTAALNALHPDISNDANCSFVLNSIGSQGPLDCRKVLFGFAQTLMHLIASRSN